MSRLSAIIFILVFSCKSEKPSRFKPLPQYQEADMNIPKPTAHNYLVEDEKAIEESYEAPKPKSQGISLSAKAPTPEATIVEKIQAEEDRESSLLYHSAHKKIIPEPSITKQKRRKSPPRKSTKRTKSHFLTLCQKGDYDSCHKFAYYESLSGNTANAERFYRLSCNKGIFKSCNNLAYNAELNGNFEKAKDYYSRACIQFHPGSCSNLKRVLKAR